MFKFTLYDTTHRLQATVFHRGLFIQAKTAKIQHTQSADIKSSPGVAFTYFV